jgi:hypothetical protein
MLVSLAPILLMAVLSAGLLYMFLRLRHHAATLRKALQSAEETHATELRETRTALADLAERVRQAEDRAGVLVAPKPLPSGLNLNKRSQAVRMLRRGATVDTVASTLMLPLPEVQLLLRVQQLAASEGGFISPDPH